MSESIEFIGKREKARIARQRRQRAMAGSFLAACIGIGMMSMGVHYSRVNTTGMLTTQVVVAEQVDAGILQQNHYPVYAVAESNDTADTSAAALTDDEDSLIVPLPSAEESTGTSAAAAQTGSESASQSGTSAETASGSGKSTGTASSGNAGTAAKAAETPKAVTSVTKPAETKPAVSTAPAETKPAVSTAPVETRPAESVVPAETKPAEETVDLKAMTNVLLFTEQTDVTVGDSVTLGVYAQNIKGGEIDGDKTVALNVSSGTVDGTTVTFTEAGDTTVTATVTMNGVTLISNSVKIHVSERPVLSDIRLMIEQPENGFHVGDTAAAVVKAYDQSGSELTDCEITLTGENCTVDGSNVTFDQCGTVTLNAKATLDGVELTAEPVTLTVTDPITLPDGTVVNAEELGEEQTICGVALRLSPVMTVDEDLDSASLKQLELNLGATSSDNTYENAEEACTQRLEELENADKLDFNVDNEKQTYAVFWQQNGMCYAEYHVLTDSGEAVVTASWNAEYEKEGAKLLSYTADSIHPAAQAEE